jgi:hypothetical protein
MSTEAWTLALHRRYERLLLCALRAADPVAVLRATASDSTTPPPLREALRAACRHADGVRITALLCARLRFERLVQVSAVAASFYASDPAGFARALHRYHTRVAAVESHRAEARRFERWLRRFRLQRSVRSA